MRYLISLLLLCIIIPSCNNKKNPAYESEILNWHKERIERLKSHTGWLNLAGLFWLKEGENTIGSDSSNTVIFPANAGDFYGTLIKHGDSITFTAFKGSKVTVDGTFCDKSSIRTDASGKPSLFEAGDLAWFIIKRDSLYGIRLRDYTHPRIKQLDSIPCYGISEKWKITTDFVPFDSIMKIEVATIIGGKEINNCPGKLVFRKGLKKYSLYPFSEGKEFFIIFADHTNGIETYGNGRFLYASLPDSSGHVVLDFNKAYNPPCAFSPFATCPMPPRENILNLSINAGEKEVHME
jgi:uncharacterized protein